MCTNYVQAMVTHSLFNSNPFFLYMTTSTQWHGSQRGVKIEVLRDKYLCIRTLLEPIFFSDSSPH